MISHNSTIKSRKDIIFLNICINDDIFKYDKNDICIKLSKNEDYIIVCPIYLPFEKNLECVEICSVLEFLNININQYYREK